MVDRLELPAEKRPHAGGLTPQHEIGYASFNSVNPRLAPRAMAPARARSVSPAREFYALTGLPVLGQVSRRIGRVIADLGRQHRTCALVAFDLDGFRVLRAAFGRASADDIISRVAFALETASCPTVVVARQGTDGFIVLMAGLASGVETAVCVQQILDAIAMPHDIGGETVRVTASAGIAMFPKDGLELETLCRNAHGAMRESKIKCPGTLRFHSENVAIVATRRLRLEMDLRRAIENDGLTVHYQPQFEVASGKVSGVEALARWFRSDGAAVDPCVFIPLAEQSQLIGALGSWVLQEACKNVGAWRTGSSESITLCVNVSPHQIDEALAGIIQHTLKCSGFPAGRLELEITESALMSNADAIIECLRQLKTMGIRIAIDDFGTGYSGLNHLSRLPVDRLKLDKSLVHNLTTRWKDVAILRSIIGLGKDLGLAVIAEGVETEQQFEVLQQLGCPQIQGYLLARPMCQYDAKRMLAEKWGARYARPAGSIPENLHAA
jgi:diguanylate cyclase (GGDEF)-like protein